jgi:hypothetical protein
MYVCVNVAALCTSGPVSRLRAADGHLLYALLDLWRSLGRLLGPCVSRRAQQRQAGHRDQFAHAYRYYRLPGLLPSG